MKKHNTICQIDLSSWKFFADLLKHGYPAMDALRFLDITMSGIEEYVEQGTPLIDVLLKGQKGRFYDHLRFFVNIMSLYDAIDSSIALLEFEKGIKTRLLKKSIYPICIIVFAYMLLWFFSTMIIPQMMSSFSMDDSFQSLAFFILCIKMFCISFALLCILFLGFSCYLMMHKQLRTQVLYKLHKKLFFLVDYESYVFSGYLIEMQKRGISTKNAMRYLSSIQADSLFKYLIDELNQCLMMGEDMLDVIAHTSLLNKTFITTFRIGATTSNLCELLITYMKQQEYVWDKYIRKISTTIQCISYTFVGFVVLIVYQIMLVPLSMLEQM
ncbi:MAG: type II secretion system F family protein [Longicatena sp.]